MQRSWLKWGPVLVIGAIFFTSLSPAFAAQTLSAVQAQVTRLQIEATVAAEAGQQAQVELGKLTRSLNSVKAQDTIQANSMLVLQKSLGKIAAQQYMNNGIGEGMSLLFSSNPTLYLEVAGTLSNVTRKQSVQLSQFTTAEQRLRATSMTLKDKLALVAMAKAKYDKQEALAAGKLKEAEALLKKLSTAQRQALAKLQAHKDGAEQKASLALVSAGIKASGRGGVALRFASKQLGSRYVFGAAGILYWDCSGLTMKAFSAAGISLPHSAAAQLQYGKSIPFNKVQPGDLVFFGQPISHVSIYWGNGKMIDAPHSGARVRIETFSSWFGNEKFVGARRF